jgi:hypothetical protein
MELQALGMSFQGAMAVRNGPNRDGKMHFFHAFALSTILGFGGGWMGFILMGKPSSMITNGDINITACFISFILANYTPFDIGHKVGNFLPFVLVYTSLAQVFRALGLVRFISAAFNEVNPSPYYPIPVLGPILYGTMLGNMGSFFVKGFDGHLKNGIPWPFQNGKVDLLPPEVKDIDQDCCSHVPSMNIDIRYQDFLLEHSFICLRTIKMGLWETF